MLFLCLVLFQRLARNWNHFILKWTNVEQYLPALRTQYGKKFIKRRITILEVVVISISLGISTWIKCGRINKDSIIQDVQFLNGEEAWDCVTVLRSRKKQGFWII